MAGTSSLAFDITGNDTYPYFTCMLSVLVHGSPMTLRTARSSFIRGAEPTATANVIGHFPRPAQGTQTPGILCADH